MKLYIWRHPKPIAAKGICLGQTDMAVDPRKLKRLAHQIQRFVRINDLPKTIWVSSLQRSRKVGQLLAMRGFDYRVEDELSEISFGIWEGCTWQQIPKSEIDEWCDNFASFAPENAENLQQLFMRVTYWLKAQAKRQAAENEEMPILVVGHAGWINAAKMLANNQPIPQLAGDWPSSVAYRQLTELEFEI